MIKMYHARVMQERESEIDRYGPFFLFIVFKCSYFVGKTRYKIYSCICVEVVEHVTETVSRSVCVCVLLYLLPLSLGGIMKIAEF